jgi:hypothetical protein
MCILPRVAESHGVPTDNLLAALHSVEVLSGGEVEPKSSFRYGWMAGSSHHKLMMMNEVLGTYPGVMKVENLMPMGGLAREGLAIQKPKEDPDEMDGTKIARDKLDYYWNPFKNFQKTLSCRIYYRNGGVVEGCAPDQFMFATDVNVSANMSGMGRNDQAVFLRNPDEEVPDWKTMSERDKEEALISYMTSNYQRLGKRGQVTNTVESALAFRRPIDPNWETALTASGASRLFVTMPLDCLVNRDFVKKYIDRVVGDALGTSRSQTTRNGVLNNIGGAAGGIFMEKMIKHMVESGSDVRIGYPDPSVSSRKYGLRELNLWDIVRGHAAGIPHVLLCDLGLSFVQRKSQRDAKNPIVLRGGADILSTREQTLSLNNYYWKSA